MSYPFMRSAVQGGTARGGRRAVVWHMAEGGNTVNFLAGPNNNGVSVHFVIQYDGDIWQMLRLDQMHTSIRITQPSGAHAIRHSNDAPYDWLGEKVVYGQSAAIAVMGDWADVHKSLGPNHASIAVEIEGFAADGPNVKQEVAIARLWADLKGRYPSIRSLGHRDFASYKACPGKKFPWDAVDGHGPVTRDLEEPMRPFPVGVDPKIVDIKVGAQLYNLDLTTTDAPTVSLGNDKPSKYAYRTGGVNYRVVEVSTAGVPHLWLVKVADCVTIAEPPAPPAPDCTAVVADAIVADRAKARITWG